MYCKSCGKKVDDDSKFCRYCGVNLDNSIISNSIQNTELEQEDVSKKDIILANSNDKNVTIKQGKSKNIVATEIVANIKMIGLSLICICIYYVGFTFYHADDRTPCDDNSYFGASCYDNGVISGTWEFSWERHFYNKIKMTAPYNEWSDLEKRMGHSPFVPLTGIDYAFISNSEPSSALSRAEAEAKRKKLPESYVTKLKEAAKSDAQRDKEDFRREISNRRTWGYEDDLSEHIKWCIIICLSFFIGGRYIIKLGKWVSKNA